LKKQIIIIGSGPAGLACAHELTTRQRTADIVLLDKNDRPGGLARTYTYKGFKFDIGPHRFYTKSPYVRSLWRLLLGKQFHRVKRHTRVYYGHRFFRYPIEIKDILTKFDGYTILGIVVSFISSKIRYALLVPATYREWIEKKFGYKLYTIFFRDYTEKVWGVSCDNISAKWAQQRIRGLDLFSLISAVLPFRREGQPRSLVHEFYYPRCGAGQMYEALARLSARKGVRNYLNTDVKRIVYNGNTITYIQYFQGGSSHRIDTGMVFSSMPVTRLIFALSPPPPPAIVRAAEALGYRDHISVNLLIKKRNVYEDNWIYVHDPAVRMARVTNFNTFNSSLKRSNMTALSVEYFVFKDEPFWKLSTKQLIDLATRELDVIGFVSPKDVAGGFVIKEEDSYPAYRINYEKHFFQIAEYLNGFTNLKCIGRGGLYKYNNMDEAMMSGQRAASEFSDGIHGAIDLTRIDNPAYLEN
jgi:protoporphyrinogen oxidase